MCVTIGNDSGYSIAELKNASKAARNDMVAGAATMTVVDGGVGILMTILAPLGIFSGPVGIALGAEGVGLMVATTGYTIKEMKISNEERKSLNSIISNKNDVVLVPSIDSYMKSLLDELQIPVPNTK